MTDKKSNDSRRKLLKSLAAGSGAVLAGKSLPDSWNKPVVNSLVLPVHAQMTTEDTRCSIPAGCIEVLSDGWGSFADDLYEGDFFAEGKPTFDSECTVTDDATLPKFVVARTEEDAIAIFGENDVDTDFAFRQANQNGECQIWLIDD